MVSKPGRFRFRTGVDAGKRPMGDLQYLRWLHVLRGQGGIWNLGTTSGLGKRQGPRSPTAHLGDGSRQPLDGTYSVGLAGDYSAISEATDSLNANGIKGNVTLEIVAGTYDEQAEILEFPRYGFASDSVLIKPQSSAVTWNFTGASSIFDNYFLKLDGAENITVDGIEFEVQSGTPTYGTIIEYGNVDGFTLKNCVLDGRPVGPDALHNLVDRLTISNDDVVFLNNEFWNGYEGLSGSLDVLISGNQFRQQFWRGLSVTSGDQARIVGNSISDLGVVSSTLYTGMQVTGSNSLIAQNDLQINTGNRGIEADGVGTTVENNMVAMLDASIVAGVDLDNDDNNTFRFNTVYVSSSSVGAALLVSTASSSTVFNNLLINEGGGFAMELSGLSPSSVTSNFNNLYSSGPRVVAPDLICCSTLGDWQAKPYSPDPNSISKTLNFVSTAAPTDLHLTGASIGDGDLAGIPIGAVTEDIDGETRNPTPPYMGADESTALDVNPQLRISLEVLLEGAYDGGGGMSNALNTAGYLTSHAETHPYGGPPWNYTGSGSVAPGFFDLNPEYVDWIYIKVFEGDINGTLTMVADTVALLAENGDVFEISESALVRINVPTLGNYYVAVYHRNHVGAITEEEIVVDAYAQFFPFIRFDGTKPVYGTNPLKDFGDGNLGLFAGDSDADGQVIASDFNTWLADTKVGATGYLASDFNMDGQVNAADFNIWLANTKAGAASQIP